jgi:serine/threonine-protein kinase
MAMGTAQSTPSRRRIAPDEWALEQLREDTLGEYEILGELGRGGMATVYLAHDLALDRKVAIKLISPLMLADSTADRFRREARTAAALSHPHIIPIYAVRETETLVFFVMKYLAGPSIDVVIRQRKQLPIPIVQAIVTQTAEALSHAHRRGVIHRDVKPGNIVLDEDGWIVVTDFGIAKSLDSSGVTTTGTTIGTPTHMSPEQCQGLPVTGASDQYSLGIVAYEMLTGQVPFQAANPVAAMYAHLNQAPAPVKEGRPDCPNGLEATVMRMLEKTPEHRWASMDDVIRAIGAPPLVHNDPIQVQMAEIARACAPNRRISLPSTPRSPLPASRRAGPRTPRGEIPTVTAKTSPDDAPTLRISEPQSQPGRIWRLALAGLVVLAAMLAIWFRPRPRSAPPPPVVTTAPADTAAPPGDTTAGAGSATDTTTTAVVAPPPPPTAPPAPPPTAGPAQPARKAVASLAISPAISRLTVGDSIQLSATALDAAGRAVEARGIRWKSSDPGIASITRNGLVTARAAGAVSIAASIEGVTHSLVLVVALPAPPPPVAPVPAAVAAIEISPPAATVAIGGTVTLRATVLDSAGAVLPDRQVRWSSSNDQVADVSVNGLVIARGAGTTQIGAASGGRAATATVTVPPLAQAPGPPPEPGPGIRRLIEDYAAAFQSRDVSRMRTLFPGLSETARATWTRNFHDYDQVTAVVIPASIHIEGQSARFDIDLTMANRRHESQHVILHSTATARYESGWTFEQLNQTFSQ